MLIVMDNQTGMVAGVDDVSGSPLEAVRHLDHYIHGRLHAAVPALAEMEHGYTVYAMPEGYDGLAIFRRDEFEVAAEVKTLGTLLGAVRVVEPGRFEPPVIHLIAA